MLAGFIAVAVFMILVVRIRGGVFGLIGAITVYLSAFYLIELYRKNHIELPEEERTIRQCAEEILHIKRLGSRAADASLRRDPGSARRDHGVRFQRIGEQLERIFEVIRYDDNKRQGAKPFILGYLIPIHTMFQQYVTLISREVGSAKEELEKTEKELPIVERKLDELYESIHENDIAALAAINETLEIWMQPSDFR